MRISNLIFHLTLLLMITGCHDARKKPASQFVEGWPVMSTLALVTTSENGKVSDLRQVATDAFEYINQTCSVFIDSSELSALNREAGKQAVPVCNEVAELLKLSIDLARYSNGAFDPTIGPLMKLWGFRSKNIIQPPSEEALNEAHAKIGWQHITLTESNQAAFAKLELSDMHIDLGAIAKGYAVDLAFEKGQKLATDFMIDLGGNIRVSGEASNGKGGWRTGIRNPFAKELNHETALIGSVLMTNGEAVATSGNYERFVTIDGQRYAHIMDPRTGRPVKGIAGVTVIAPSAALADGLSTTLFVLGPDEGYQLLCQHYPACEALWVPDNETELTLIVTPNLLPRLDINAEWQKHVQVLK